MFLCLTRRTKMSGVRIHHMTMDIRGVLIADDPEVNFDTVTVPGHPVIVSVVTPSKCYHWIEGGRKEERDEEG